MSCKVSEEEEKLNSERREGEGYAEEEIQGGYGNSKTRENTSLIVCNIIGY
jgi:hypothetical protein